MRQTRWCREKPVSTVEIVIERLHRRRHAAVRRWLFSEVANQRITHPARPSRPRSVNQVANHAGDAPCSPGPLLQPPILVLIEIKLGSMTHDIIQHTALTARDTQRDSRHRTRRLFRVTRIERGTVCVTLKRMASRIVRARLDEASDRALSLLMREGRNESDAVRTALTEAGRRRVRRSALAAEVSRLAADPQDTAERHAVMADMDAIAADWPE